MILRIRRRVRIRPLKVELQLRLASGWLLFGAACAAAIAAQPPPPAPPPPARAVPTSAADPPDEGFIEFLGSDDVGDAAWWEFLKKAPLRGNDPPAPPPQDAKK
jgi:hypothetical protein